MSKSRFNFSDIKIGDLVLTTNNKIGEIIALKSYAYLNDKITKKSRKSSENDESFKFDNNRHNGIWYSAITIAIEDPSANVPTYYTECLDFIEIKEIIKHAPTESVLSKIKKYLNHGNR